MNTNKKARGRPKKITPGRPASPFFDEYLNMNTGERQVMTLAGISRFTTDFVNWAKNDEEALVLLDFPMRLGITKTLFYKWRDRSDELKEGIEHAKFYIASRRERGAINRKYDLKAISIKQYQLDSDWNDAEIRQLKMKNEQLEQQLSSLVKYVDMSRPKELTEEEFKKEVEGTKS